MENEEKKVLLRQEVQDLISVSPRLALAVAQRKSFVPYVFVVSASWSTSVTPQPLLNVESNPTNIDMDLLILSIDVDVQTPNFNAGSLLKPEADLAYDLTSGIQCDVRIEGFLERATPYFPLKALPSFGTVGAGAAGAFRNPWALLADQNLYMDFIVTTALPSSSTVITCTYTCAYPVPYGYYRMDYGKALDELESCGYCIDGARKQFCAP
ncbi:MAG: hypothetical protein ACYDDA_05165 [Acidiferrobacteraceae bacterium]